MYIQLINELSYHTGNEKIIGLFYILIIGLQESRRNCAISMPAHNGCGRNN